MLANNTANTVQYIVKQFVCLSRNHQLKRKEHNCFLSLEVVCVRTRKLIHDYQRSCAMWRKSYNYLTNHSVNIIALNSIILSMIVGVFKQTAKRNFNQSEKKTYIHNDSYLYIHIFEEAQSWV